MSMGVLMPTSYFGDPTYLPWLKKLYFDFIDQEKKLCSAEWWCCACWQAEGKIVLPTELFRYQCDRCQSCDCGLLAFSQHLESYGSLFFYGWFVNLIYITKKEPSIPAKVQGEKGI